MGGVAHVYSPTMNRTVPHVKELFTPNAISTEIGKPSYSRGTWATVLKRRVPLIIFVFWRANSDNSIEDTSERRETEDEIKLCFILYQIRTMCQALGTQMNK